MSAPTAQSAAYTGPPSRWQGWVAGTVAALIWAGYQVLTKQGLSSGAGGGFTPLDLTLFRFGLPGLLLLPVLLRRRAALQKLGVRRVMALTVVAGPLLGLSTAQGYSLAPLAHGAVLFPAFTTLAGVLLSRWVLGAPQTGAQLAGLAIIVGGLLLVGGVTGGSALVWLGDALFLFSGLLWGGYTVLLRRWQLDGLTGAAIAGASSSVVTVLLYVAMGDFEGLSQIATMTLWTQCLFQGVLAGVVAVVAYGMAVQKLGAAGAALFPATVPLLALLLGVTAFEAVVAPLQWLGLAITTIGLLLAAGVIKRSVVAAPPVPPSL